MRYPELVQGASVVYSAQGVDYGGPGTIIYRGSFEPDDPSTPETIVVHWGEDEDGPLTGDWFVNEGVPLRAI